MKFKDYYQVLEVQRSATPDEIKRSYRRLARKFHPDVSEQSDAEERFKEVQEAYAVLKDGEKRAAYDQFGDNWDPFGDNWDQAGHNWQHGEQFRPPPDWAGGAPFNAAGGDVHSGHTHFGQGEFSDFFDMLFGQPGQSRAGRAGWRARGEDTLIGVTLPLEDAYFGATRNMSIRVQEVDDRGRLVNRNKSLSTRIPKGITAGQRIRLAGQGEAGQGGAPSGDLYLEVSFEPHRLFRAEGRDIHLTLPVTPWEAALGRTVTVPTLGGKVDLKIPAGSQAGAKLRLKGRGLPAADSRGRPAHPPGDQYVQLEIVTPPANSDRARAIYAQMEKELNFDPRAALEA